MERLQNELFCPRDWKSRTIEQFIAAVDSYIRWYNEKQIKISLGSLRPIAYRMSLGVAAKNHSEFLSAPSGHRSAESNTQAFSYPTA